MLEPLRSIIDTVHKIVSDLTDRKRRNSVTELGSELYLIYIRINETVALADRIIDVFQSHGERISYSPGDGAEEPTLMDDDQIDLAIQTQLKNIFEIQHAMQRWSHQLQILNGPATTLLTKSFEGKSSLLQFMALAMDRERRQPDADKGLQIDQSVVHHSVIDKWPLSICPADSSGLTRKATLDFVRIRITSPKSHTQLDDIRSSIEKVKQALESNFVVADVLLNLHIQERKKAVRSAGNDKHQRYRTHERLRDTRTNH